MEYLLLLMSFVVGVLIGLTSMGGAALMTPVLILFAGVRPAIAVGTDLAYCAITKLAGAWMHWRQDTVDLRMARRLAYGSLPGGLLGVVAVTQLHSYGFDTDLFLRRAIGFVLLIVALLIILQSSRGGLIKPVGLEAARLAGWSAVVWGAVVGFSVGLTSVGSGSLIAPFLMMVYPRSPARVVGTDVFHAAILVTATAMVHSTFGNIDWHLASLLLLGSIPGVLLGSYLAPRIPERRLRMGLALLLLASGAKLI